MVTLTGTLRDNDVASRHEKSGAAETSFPQNGIHETHLVLLLHSELGLFQAKLEFTTLSKICGCTVYGIALDPCSPKLTASSGVAEVSENVPKLGSHRKILVI